MFKLSDAVMKKLSNLFTKEELQLATCGDVEDNFVAMATCGRTNCSNDCDCSCRGTCTYTCHRNVR